MKYFEAPAGHTPRYVGASYMLDSYECQCGWRSNNYFDGIEYAWSDWKRHAAEIVKLEDRRMFTEEQTERYRRHAADGGWIAVDFDGTLAEYHGWTDQLDFGAPIPLMVARVREWLKMGLEVRVLTARFVPGGFTTKGGTHYTEEEFQREMGDWTERHCGARLRATCTKDFYMIELWDDRAVQVVSNTGRTLAEEHEAELAAIRGAP